MISSLNLFLCISMMNFDKVTQIRAIYTVHYFVHAVHYHNYSCPIRRLMKGEAGHPDQSSPSLLSPSS